MAKTIYRDERGAIISMEMVLIVTIALVAIIVGWSEVAIALNTELNDVSNATAALNQGFWFTGYQSGSNGVAVKPTSSVFGSSFEDKADDCDTNQSCDIVCGLNSASKSEQ
ncbi:MAG: hypothetical protein JWM11_1055 [Planctomycetaceae bacterium]|nr:hypothetical protein [Planctomycetaceae bacterium]